MESNSVLAAFSGPIPSNPQVIILPFPHHSMLLLSNQSSDAKASTSNPHSLVSFLPNKSPWCSWTTEHSVKQPPSPSPFQTNRVPFNPFPARPQITGGVWRVEFRNLWVSFSQNASRSLINIVHWSTDRVVGELRTLTFPRLTSPSPLEWRRKKWRIDCSLLSLTVYPKDRQGTTGVGVSGIG